LGERHFTAKRKLHGLSTFCIQHYLTRVTLHSVALIILEPKKILYVRGRKVVIDDIQSPKPIFAALHRFEMNVFQSGIRHWR